MGECGVNTGIHWRKWDKMNLGKSEGGLEFKVMVLFGKAMFAKQARRITNYYGADYRKDFFPESDY